MSVFSLDGQLYLAANEWVWLGSQICTEWLKIPLAQVSSASSQQKSKCKVPAQVLSARDRSSNGYQI